MRPILCNKDLVSGFSPLYPDGFSPYFLIQ